MCCSVVLSVRKHSRLETGELSGVSVTSPRLCVASGFRHLSEPFYIAHCAFHGACWYKVAAPRSKQLRCAHHAFPTSLTLFLGFLSQLGQKPKLLTMTNEACQPCLHLPSLQLPTSVLHVSSNRTGLLPRQACRKLPLLAGCCCWASCVLS